MLLLLLLLCLVVGCLLVPNELLLLIEIDQVFI